MTKSIHHFKSSHRLQRGTTLVEILVTLFVLAVGLLGAAGLQLSAVRYQQTAQTRAIAMAQTQVILEKMRANTGAIVPPAPPATPLDAYVVPDDYSNATLVPNDPGCGLVAGPVGCTAAQAAQRDIRDWRLSLQQALPQGRGAIFTVAGAGGLVERGTRRIVVMWVEKAQDSDDNQNAVAPTDPDCPLPAVPGVRCYSTQVAP
jgi:type IV pilus assembly protein PilV